MYYKIKHWHPLDFETLSRKHNCFKIGDKDYDNPRTEPIRTYVWCKGRVAKKAIKAALKPSDPASIDKSQACFQLKDRDVYVEPIYKDVVIDSLSLFKPKPGYLYTASQPYGIPNPPNPKINMPGFPPYDWGQEVKVCTAPAVFRLFNDKNVYKISRCPYCWLTGHEHSISNGHRATHCPDRYDFGGSEAKYKNQRLITKEAKGINFKHDDSFRVMIDDKWYHENDGYIIITIL